VNSLKIEKLKKLDFYTSTKSKSRNGCVRKEKKELLTNFNLKKNPNGGNVAGRISKSIQLFFLGNC
jgi:hypothetical protein